MRNDRIMNRLSSLLLVEVCIGNADGKLEEKDGRTS